MAYHKSSKKDVYQLVTDRIIALLEAGTVPWRKPWKRIAPQNLVSGKAHPGPVCTGAYPGRSIDQGGFVQHGLRKQQAQPL